jgi:hypothetical protein
MKQGMTANGHPWPLWQPHPTPYTPGAAAVVNDSTVPQEAPWELSAAAQK